MFIEENFQTMHIAKTRKARFTFTMNLITFYIVILCGVIPFQGKAQGTMLLEQQSLEAGNACLW